jgi:serine/threonine-protein kinase PpkA
MCHDQPELAIVDVQMPVLDGLALIDALARRLGGQPFPLVVLSSVEDEAVLKDAFRRGVTDYLVKPVAESELAVKLERALAQHSDRRPQVPRELGGLELLGEVRRGELAAIYEAYDPWAPAGTPTAFVKVLRPDLCGDPGPLLALRREVDLVAGCDHPGIVRPTATGLEGPFLYYTAAEIPMRTLGREVREDGPLPPPQVLKLLRQTASALEHLHAQAVVVGDLTPESLGRAADGSFLLSELGRARWLLPLVRADEDPLPRSRYAPPEQFEADQVDELTDLYALGVIALEAASGKPAARRRGTGTVDADGLGAELPPATRELLARLVAPNPRARPQSASDLLAQLDRHGR